MSDGQPENAPPREEPPTDPWVEDQMLRYQRALISDVLLFFRVCLWVSFGLVLLWVLSLNGFSRWKVSDVAQVLTAWPPAVALIVIAAIAIFWRPIAGLISRIRRLKNQGTNFDAEFDPRDNVFIPPTPIREAVEGEVGQEFPPTPITRDVPTRDVPEQSNPDQPPEESRSGDPTPADADRDVKSHYQTEVPATETPSLEDERPVRPSKVLTGRPPFRADHPVQSAIRRRYAERVSHQYRRQRRKHLLATLGTQLATVPEMRVFTREEVEHALDILERNDVANADFISRLVNDRSVAIFLDRVISALSARPWHKSLDPASFCSWGAVLHQNAMDELTVHRVNEEIMDAVSKGLLKP